MRLLGAQELARWVRAQVARVRQQLLAQVPAAEQELGEWAARPQQRGPVLREQGQGPLQGLSLAIRSAQALSRRQRLHPRQPESTAARR